MLVIAFDPGEHTGYAVLEYGTGGSLDQFTGFHLVEAGQIPWRERCASVKALLNRDPLQVGVVLLEQFRLYPHKAQAQIGSIFPSARVIGVIEAYAFEAGLSEKVDFQMASEMQRVAIRPEHQTRLTSEHMRDAYKHGRLWLVKQSIERPILL